MKTISTATIALVVAVFVTSACNGQQQAVRPDDNQPGVKPLVGNVVLEVDTEGAHLEEGHRLRVIGPVGATGFYILVPEPGGNGPPWRWSMNPVIATPFPPPNNSNDYFINPRVDNAADHPNPTVHTMVMRVESNNPLAIRIIAPDHVGLGGSHGGSAHASL